MLWGPVTPAPGSGRLHSDGGRRRRKLVAKKSTVRLRRIYDDPGAADGTRVLVDRVWPRGISKEKARIDEWCKDVAPSTELRTWYGHDPDRFAEFSRRYRLELDEPERSIALAHLKELAGAGALTLLTATKSFEISQAAVLLDVLGGAHR